MRFVRLSMLLFMLGPTLLLGPAASSASASASTTYAAETQNNTATCAAGSATSPSDCTGTFPGQTDTVTPNVETPLFDPPAGNVSTQDIHGLLYPGSTARVFVNVMQGFCTPPDGSGSPGVPRCNSNVMTDYTSDNTATVDAQLRDMARRHVDGLVPDWYGPGSSVNDTTLKFQQEIRNLGFCPGGPQRCQLMYLIMYDGSTLKFPVTATGIPGTTGSACSTSASATDAENCIIARLKNDICYMNGFHFGNDAYQKFDLGGSGLRPMVQFFVDESHMFTNLPATGAAPSWADVWSWVRQWSNNLVGNCATAPYNANNGAPLFLFENAGGFTHAQSDGAFDWVNPTQNQDDLMISPATAGGTVDNFYSTARSFDASKIVWGAAYRGFNDTQSAWGARRLIDQRCGQTWVQSFASAGGFYGSSHQLPFVQVATWNDYNEGTPLEIGTDNCYKVSASVSGSTLSWSLAASSGNASQSTISSFAVFDSTDGTNFTQVASLSPSARSFDLSGLSTGSHTLFVKMVGQPGILNRSSAELTFSH